MHLFILIPRRACPRGRAPSDLTVWRFAMSFAINDSCVESLSAVAAQHEDWIIQQAIVLLEKRIFKAGPCLSRPAAVRDYLRVKLVAEPNEIFAAVFLDSMHQVLAYEPLFR